MNSFKNIKLVGVGKGGSNLVSRLSTVVFPSAKALAISTIYEDLEELKLKEKILVTTNPKDTKAQVLQIRKSIYGYTSVLIFAQFGADNSAHLASAIANIASDMNINSVAICSVSHKIDKYITVSINKLKEHCKNILWLPEDMTISEMFSQEDIVRSLAGISEMDKQIPLPKEDNPKVYKSLIDKLIGRKQKEADNFNSDEVLTQEEFGFNTLAEQRGYFLDTPRNMHNGTDLDIPTYLRKKLKIQL